MGQRFFTKDRVISFIFVLLVAVSFTTRYADFVTPMWAQYGVAMVAVAFSFVVAFRRWESNTKFLLKYFFVPVLLIHVYSIVMTLLGRFDITFLSTNLTAYVPVLLAIAVINMFGSRSIKMAFVSLGIAWSVSVLASLLIKGPGIFPYAIQQGYFDGYEPILGVRDNFLELHDMVFSVGMLLIYYCGFNKSKLTKKKLLIIAFMLTIFLLGIKRIAIAGLIVALFVAKFLNSRSDKVKPRVILVIGVVMMALCYGYVFLIMNEDLGRVLLEDFGINMMGRNYYFETAAKMGEFSVLYPGIGRNAVSMLFQTDYSYLKVGGVHCDILKMYIENGFLVFGLWLWYYLIKLPKVLYNKFGIKTYVLYFTLIIYTFVLYTTDNVENYFVYQSFLIMIPVAYGMMTAKTEKKKLKDTS